MNGLPAYHGDGMDSPRYVQNERYISRITQNTLALVLAGGKAPGSDPSHPIASNPPFPLEAISGLSTLPCPTASIRASAASVY